MASAGCFLERRPLAASNGSLDLPFHTPPRKGGQFPPRCFSLHVNFPSPLNTHTPHTISVWNGQLSVISLYPRLYPSFIRSLSETWNICERTKLGKMNLSLRHKNYMFILFSHGENACLYYSRFQKFLLRTSLNEIKNFVKFYTWK